jgi:ketosteroid isomerase-like protein
MAGSELSSPSQLARRIFDAIDRHDRAELEERIHPEATLEMAMARGELIQGRQNVLRVLEEAWQRVHDLSIQELHPLSDDAVVVVGRSRYPTKSGGFADSACVWLCEYRNGMLWRQRIFRSLDEALESAR